MLGRATRALWLDLFFLQADLFLDKFRGLPDCPNPFYFFRRKLELKSFFKRKNEIEMAGGIPRVYIFRRRSRSD